MKHLAYIVQLFRNCRSTLAFEPDSVPDFVLESGSKVSV